MTPHEFALVFTVAAAALALWILARYAGFGPKTLLWALLHVLVACALLRAVPPALERARALNGRGMELVAIFSLALPALVYGFLSGGWVTRIAVGLLKRP